MPMSSSTSGPEAEATPLPRFVPVPHDAVTFTGGFWGSWSETIRRVTVPTQYLRLEEEGFLEVLDVHLPPASLVRPIQPSGLSMQHFFDSDFGKWIEAASYTLKKNPDPGLVARIDAMVDRMAAGQMPDGYFNSWFVRREPEKRWTNLRDWHEMYSLGHLIEGAIAYFEATGKRRFLDLMVRAVDHLIDMFGPGPAQRRGYDAHAEIEIALIRLYRLTGDPRHLAMARFLIDERGRQPSYFDEEARRRGEDPAGYVYKDHSYSQAHRPVREQVRVVGHAVRAAYLFSAMVDVAGETGDTSLLETCRRLFDDLTGRKMYVTGGIGSQGSNEGFSCDDDLPNASAYAETCAAVALGLWSHRMAQLDLDARYTDQLELVLFNGALSGIARDGEHYFYENVLESRGGARRWRWHYCPCCPTNIARLVASVGGYVYAARADALAVHLYAAGTASVSVGGHVVEIRQDTTYPWAGDVRLSVAPASPATFTLLLRIPSWCSAATLQVNGAAVALDADKGYAAVRREWRAGDEVRLQLDMPVQRVYAHPRVADDLGRVALKRGPLVYCLEEADTGIPPQRLRLPRGEPILARFEPGFLGGATLLEGEAEMIVDHDWDRALYRATPPSTRRVRFIAIPYHLWANRAPGAMQVWMRE